MLMVCPECYQNLKKQGKEKEGKELLRCFLRKVDIFPQYPEAGQCPYCRKIWNEDGREIIVTGHINVELKEKEYNPSRRE
jgi:uncharacterized CHY-type Zn-finger protein